MYVVQTIYYICYCSQDKYPDDVDHCVTFGAGSSDIITFGAWKSTAEPDAGFDPKNPRPSDCAKFGAGQTY